MSPGQEGEWEGLERRQRVPEESVARGELERGERKRKVEDCERRHQVRLVFGFKITIHLLPNSEE
jgi:hypothetical protein